MVQTKYDASLDGKLTGAIRDQPGFDNAMAVGKTRLLLPKRLNQATIQFQNAADARKMDRWSKLKSGRSTGELTFARFAVAAARPAVTFGGQSACHVNSVQEFSNGKARSQGWILLKNWKNVSQPKLHGIMLGPIAGVGLAAYLWESNTKGSRLSRQILEPA